MLQSNFVNTYTEEAIESVCINRVSVLNGLNLGENVRASFSQGRSKLSAIMRCPY